MADQITESLPRLADALLEVGTRLGEIGAELHALTPSTGGARLAAAEPGTAQPPGSTANPAVATDPTVRGSAGTGMPSAATFIPHPQARPADYPSASSTADPATLGLTSQPASTTDPTQHDAASATNPRNPGPIRPPGASTADLPGTAEHDAALPTGPTNLGPTHQPAASTADPTQCGVPSATGPGNL